MVINELAQEQSVIIDRASFKPSWPDNDASFYKKLFKTHPYLEKTSTEEAFQVAQKKALVEKVTETLDYEPTQEEIKSFFLKNKERYKTEASRLIWHILMPIKEDLIVLKKKVTARNFKKMAKKYSQAEDAPSGGRLGWIEKSKDSLISTLFETKVGSVSDIVESHKGFHLFFVEKARKPSQKRLKQVSKEIEAELIRAKRQKLFNAYIREQLAKKKVQVNFKLLDSLQLEVSP